jgi:hypothetical protein
LVGKGLVHNTQVFPMNDFMLSSCPLIKKGAFCVASLGYSSKTNFIKTLEE